MQDCISVYFATYGLNLENRVVNKAMCGVAIRLLRQKASEGRDKDEICKTDWN